MMRITVTTTTPAQSANIPLFGIHGNSLNSRDNSQSIKPKILVISFQMPFRILSTKSFSRSVSHLNGFQPDEPLSPLLPDSGVEVEPGLSPPGVTVVPPPGVGVGVGFSPGSGVGVGAGDSDGEGVSVGVGLGDGLGEGVGVAGCCS